MYSVEDKDLNEYFQKVRNKVSDKYFIETHTHYHKHWFRNDDISKLYTLYYAVSGEYQVFNFPCNELKCPSDIHIHTYATRETLITYFIGLLNGYDQGRKDENLERR